MSTAITKMRSLGPIAEFVEKQGGSIERIFNYADLPYAMIEQPDLVIPMSEHLRLLDSIAFELSDGAFAAKLSTAAGVGFLGDYGTWVMSAPTLEFAIERANESIPQLLQSHTLLRCRQRGEDIHWTFVLLDGATCGRLHNDLLALGYMLDLLRKFAGSHFGTVRATVEAAAISDGRAIRDAFGCDIVPGATTAVIFPRRLLACSSAYSVATGTYPHLAPPIRCSEGLETPVRALIDIALLHGYPKVDWAATKLGYSKRTFQRACQKEGFTFNQLVESMLSERACSLLNKSALSVSEVACRLGYSDVAHFSRAFKNWTGLTPRIYRNAVAREIGLSP